MTNRLMLNLSTAHSGDDMTIKNLSTMNFESVLGNIGSPVRFREDNDSIEEEDLFDETGI